ncbi:PREDICTED: coiled-coil-helix-coiled-coil-helix domain-containing protein 1 [Nicrophorus vespilloides]|uniref:Coiled-coil-helix-coiled-coil-helix domain-containing protein 1 n=1 Tax=Nicrophorus vespilloides TaxID=110193 RepID=A0ABM1M1R9_NICVS|nr:PREDICTED: coiled-coil-helix-coiled-coil-helix domain-containing protein 1 [Nicrophorus vespilloides]
MRTFAALLAARGARKETSVPYQEILPLKLKQRVSGKGDNSSDVCCIQEMSLMLACFKLNEFDQSLCSKEVQNFSKCYQGHLQTKQKQKEMDEKGILRMGERNLSHKQLNKYLRKFPNI